MKKTILITGATDGIGLLTAQKLSQQGHHILLHGRNQARLDNAVDAVGGSTDCYLADMSILGQVQDMADAIVATYERVDVLINNAGVFKTPQPTTADGLDVRFVVNTLAPYFITKLLLPLIPSDGRVVSLSSAAQAPVDIAAMVGDAQLDDFAAYAQSKLALTIWSAELAKAHPHGPMFVSVNPGSLLASKMVREGFGTPGKDLNIGADILVEAALDASFAQANGKYFDNDAGQFSSPHPAAANAEQVRAVMETIATLLPVATTTWS